MPVDAPRPARVRIVGAHDDMPDLAIELASVARDEGFAMLDRLVADWATGVNRFDSPGELLLVAESGPHVVGLAGLNLDPWAGGDSGRVRRLYVQPDHRRDGIGALLLREVIAAATTHGFEELRLRTTTRRGATFFEAFGFMPVDDAHATHVLPLR